MNTGPRTASVFPYTAEEMEQRLKNRSWRSGVGTPALNSGGRTLRRVHDIVPGLRLLYEIDQAGLIYQAVRSGQYGLYLPPHDPAAITGLDLHRILNEGVWPEGVSTAP
jgi:hypothetical protein